MDDNNVHRYEDVRVNRIPGDVNNEYIYGDVGVNICSYLSGKD